MPITLTDALVILIVTNLFTHWVRWHIKTRRGAYWAGVGVMFVFYLGAMDYCAG